MQNTTAKNHIAKLLALTLLTSDTCAPLVHAEQDPLGQLYNAITYEDVRKAKAALAADLDWANDGKTDHQFSALHFAVGHTCGWQKRRREGSIRDRLMQNMASA